MSQHIAGEEGFLFRRALGAKAAGRAGLVILCLIGAGRTGFQVLLLGNLRREAVCFKRCANRHIAGRHDELIIFDGRRRIAHAPAREVISGGRRSGQSDLGTCGCLYGRGIRRAAADDFNCNMILPQRRAGDEIQPLIFPILDMGACVIRCKIVCVVRAVDIGERHRIALILRGDADARAIRYGTVDCQRLAGGQIDVVRLAGDGIAGHDGDSTEPQLSVVVRADVNAAAGFCGILLDLTAGEIAD